VDHVAFSFAARLEEYKRKERKSRCRNEVRGGLENWIKGKGKQQRWKRKEGSN